MSDLPNGWAETAVNALAESRSGNSKLVKGTLLKEPTENSYPAFSASGQDVWVNHAEHEGEAIIVSAVGARCGKAFLASGQWSAVANTHIIFPHHDLVDQRWLWFRLNDENFWVRGGSAQPFVRVTKSLETVIPLPPLPEQRRIVAKVDGLTARTARARKDLNRIPTLIARYKQRLLALAAEGLLTRNWHDQNGSPGWVRITVAELAETTFDGPFGSNLKSADYVESGVRVVRLENIGSLRFIREKETYVSKTKFKSLQRHELRPNDVLFSSFIAEEIRVCLLPEDLETIAINKADCFCVRADPEICLPKFLAYRLASPTCYEVLKEAVHGATRPRISLTHLKQFEFDLPTIEEQAEIVRRIESAFGWLDRMAADHAAAALLLPKLDAAILAKAFQGKLAPQDPNDEPAAKLLERIKVERDADAAMPKSGQGRKQPKVHHLQGVSASTGPPQVSNPTLTVNRTNPKRSTMTKSRQDEDVKDKPYLAGLLKSGSRRDVQTLFRTANLPVADFYKQLASEIGKGYILDDPNELKAA
ncbi:MAG: restriction endonuclease subunit S [Pseudomonadota bacterium]